MPIGNIKRDFDDVEGPTKASTNTKSSPKIYSDDEIKSVLRAEREASVGFSATGGEDDLSRQREKALEYIKGEMKDVPSLANRSSATDSTVADTIETILPDLMEIYTEEDTVTFEPNGDDDVEAAKYATDLVRKLIFQDNRGWLNLYSAFKDALSVKLGVWKFYSEEMEDVQTQTIPAEAKEAAAAQYPDAEYTQNDDGSYEMTVTIKTRKTRFEAIPPEDFGATDDTVLIQDTTYCVHRSEPRIQDLIHEQGYDYDKVMLLGSEGEVDDDRDSSRDLVQESQSTPTDSTDMLRRVIIHGHYIKTDFDGELKTWKIVTNADESVMLDKEEYEDGMPFATITPFINPHRLIGLSMADKTIETQKVKTSLKRMMLDSGYFALNQRLEVADDRSNEFTQGDVLRNEPGMFVRVKTNGAVTPIQSGSLNFDVHGALEYEATQAEMRSGVIRNAQGLNPDSLHDTASGQASILTMTQKRTRMIARAFAETGFKDLCVGMYNLERKYAASDLPERKDMKIEIGSGGKVEQLQAMQILGGVVAQVVEAQGGPSGPVVDMDSLYQAADKYSDILPIKGLDKIFKQPPPPQPDAPPPPDPEMEKVKAELQMKQQEMQAAQQAKAQEAQMAQQAKQIEFNMKGEEIRLSNELKREEAAAKVQLMREDAHLKMQLARDKAAFEADLAERKFQQEAAMAERQMEYTRQQNERSQAAGFELKKNRPGGDLNK